MLTTDKGVGFNDGVESATGRGRLDQLVIGHAAKYNLPTQAASPDNGWLAHAHLPGRGLDCEDVLARLTDFINARLDELFPRPWLDQWRHAREQGWRPDDRSSYCPRCGSTVDATAHTPQGCPFCRGRRLPWSGLTRLGAYADPIDQWIVQLKFHRQWRWATLLGQALGQAMPPPSQDGDRVIVCPVPLHPLRRVRRGYNQSLLIAREVARAHGLPMVPLLRRWVWSRPQSSLAVSDRPANVRRVFSLPSVDMTGHRVWLVDDVKTTGATLKACARLLRQAGASDVHVAVVAVADPKGTHFQRIAPAPASRSAATTAEGPGRLTDAASRPGMP